MSTDKNAIRTILGGVTYSAEFVPLSKSRNATEPRPSLNWRITLARKGARPIVTDYMQGIGHVPDHRSMRQTIDVEGYEKNCAESGTYAPGGLYIRNPNGSNGAKNGARAKLPAPDMLDVLHSLVLDASAIDAGSFEDWAGEYGYDTDSRAAEAIYNQCVALGLQLRALLGAARLEQLRELFADY